MNPPFRSNFFRGYIALLCLSASTVAGLAQTQQTITATPASQTVYEGQAANFVASGAQTWYTWSQGVSIQGPSY